MDHFANWLLTLVDSLDIPSVEKATTLTPLVGPSNGGAGAEINQVRDPPWTRQKNMGKSMYRTESFNVKLSALMLSEYHGNETSRDVRSLSKVSFLNCSDTFTFIANIGRRGSLTEKCLSFSTQSSATTLYQRGPQSASSVFTTLAMVSSHHCAVTQYCTVPFTS